MKSFQKGAAVLSGRVEADSAGQASMGAVAIGNTQTQQTLLHYRGRLDLTMWSYTQAAVLVLHQTWGTLTPTLRFRS